MNLFVTQFNAGGGLLIEPITNVQSELGSPVPVVQAFPEGVLVDQDGQEQIWLLPVRDSSAMRSDPIALVKQVICSKQVTGGTIFYHLDQIGRVLVVIPSRCYVRLESEMCNQPAHAYDRWSFQTEIKREPEIRVE